MFVIKKSYHDRSKKPQYLSDDNPIAFEWSTDQTEAMQFESEFEADEVMDDIAKGPTFDLEIINLDVKEVGA